jgi:hypothetical protein
LYEADVSRHAMLDRSKPTRARQVGDEGGA